MCTTRLIYGQHRFFYIDFTFVESWEVSQLPEGIFKLKAGRYEVPSLDLTRTFVTYLSFVLITLTVSIFLTNTVSLLVLSIPLGIFEIAGNIWLLALTDIVVTNVGTGLSFIATHTPAIANAILQMMVVVLSILLNPLLFVIIKSLDSSFYSVVEVTNFIFNNLNQFFSVSSTGASLESSLGSLLGSSPEPASESSIFSTSLSSGTSP